jgi:16S rRNA (adenine1518-N6/adenine1519-N6)-dimethyltransferase
MSHKARKRFGQNFLVDEQVIDRIVSAIDPQEDDLIVEIGPGQGALTRPLFATGARLRVIEIDRDLAQALPNRVIGLDAADIHQGDALKTNLASLVPGSSGQKMRVVGNLPYNISTPLLAKLLEQLDVIEDMHFMLQQEVVRRMAAVPGNKDYGRLTIMCQYHCQVIPLFTVPASAFNPVPKVESGFVRLVPHDQPPVAVSDHALFVRVVAQAFSQRRKTLRNSLRKVLTAEQIAEAGIDPGLRPESLGLDEYARLTEVVAHYGGIQGR